MLVMSIERLVLLVALVLVCMHDIKCDGGDDTDFGTGDTACHLTSQSLYSYVVRVWNTAAKNTSSHGSILSYRIILTTCAPYVTYNEDTSTTTVRSPEHYKVVGQKIRDINNKDWSEESDNICYQVRQAITIIIHPNCQLRQSYDFYFNFAIMKIDRPFLVFRKFSYPALQLPNTLAVAIYYVVLVNVVRRSKCEIPLFYFHAHIAPTFAGKMEVASYRWFVECVPRICEMDPYVRNTVLRYPGQHPVTFEVSEEKHLEERNKTIKMCETAMRRMMNFTNLCVYFPRTTVLRIGVQYMDIRGELWTGGAPLVCNGTMIGLVSSAKDRSKMFSNRHDFYIVNTVVRVWSWLLENRPKFGQDWLQSHAVDTDMKNRGDTPRDGYPKPPVDPNLFRSWPDDYDSTSAAPDGRREMIFWVAMPMFTVTKLFLHLH